MEASSDIVQKIAEYEARADLLVKNADELVSKGELGKAGEFYWGAVACYINSLHLFYTGRTHSGHGEMVREAKRIASARHNQGLFDAIRDAEKLHANYYHGFISDEEFPKYYGSARLALSGFRSILREAYHPTVNG